MLLNDAGSNLLVILVSAMMDLQTQNPDYTYSINKTRQIELYHSKVLAALFWVEEKDGNPVLFSSLRRSCSPALVARVILQWVHFSDAQNCGKMVIQECFEIAEDGTFLLGDEAEEFYEDRTEKESKSPEYYVRRSVN